MMKESMTYKIFNLLNTNAPNEIIVNYNKMQNTFSMFETKDPNST